MQDAQTEGEIAVSKSEAPIIVTIVGNTVDEIREKLFHYAKEFGYDPTAQQLPFALPNHTSPAATASSTNSTNTNTPTLSAAASTAAEKNENAEKNEKTEMRGRHKKDCACEKCTAKKGSEPQSAQAEAAAPQKQTESQPAAEKAAEVKAAPQATQDQVTDAMRRMLNLYPDDRAKSKQEVVAILGKFGATSFSSLKPEHYGAFVEQCEATLKKAA